MSHFSAMLIATRNDKGYTQEQLAKKLGIRQSTLCNWETGTRIPQLESVVRLADELDLSVITLVQSMVLDIRDTNRETTPE